MLLITQTGIYKTYGEAALLIENQRKNSLLKIVRRIVASFFQIRHNNKEVGKPEKYYAR